MAKKFTKENPALGFISKETIEDTEKREAQATATEEDYQKRIEELEALVERMNEKKEPKTKNVTILMRPKEHKRLKASAKKHNVSMNVFIETAIERYIDELEKEEESK